jgi:hypothetical protein
MANYPVKITLVDNVHAVPVPGRIVMNVGDTVQYDTEPAGRDFRVVFSGSPFALQDAFTINDRLPHPLLTAGRFFCQCFINRPGDNREVGWSANEAPVESGGDHDVRP